MMVASVKTSPTLVVEPARELFHLLAYQGGSPRAKYAVTADGSRFLMSSDQVIEPGDRTAEQLRVHVVLNWHEELKRLVPTN